MFYLKRLISFALAIALSSAVYSQQCEEGNIEIAPQIKMERTDNTPLVQEEIAGVELLYRLQGSEQSTKVFMEGDSCFIDVPLPNTMMIAGTVVAVDGSRTINPEIFILTINEIPTDPVLPEVPENPAPPGGVELRVNVPEGYTVQLKVL